MKKLQKIMNEIAEWSDATFGEGQRTVPILHHLKKEVDEAIEVCSNMPKGTPDAKLEFADMLMLVLDAATHFDIDAEELIMYTKQKLEINKKRRWGVPDSNGVVEHLR